MKIYFSILVLGVLLVAACGSEPKTSETEACDSTKTVASEELPLLKIVEFDSIAANFVDKQVQVKGIVDHVCKHGGKKLFLVADGGDIHIESEERFDDSLMGSEIIVTGIVREFRVDESYCSQMEEDNIKSHSEGQSSEEKFNRKKEHITSYRDSMKAASVEHLSFYTLEFIDLK